MTLPVGRFLWTFLVQMHVGLRPQAPEGLVVGQDSGVAACEHRMRRPGPAPPATRPRLGFWDFPVLCLCRCGLVFTPERSRAYLRGLESRSACPALSHPLRPSWVTAWRRHLLMGGWSQGSTQECVRPPSQGSLPRGLPPLPHPSPKNQL